MKRTLLGLFIASLCAGCDKPQPSQAQSEKEVASLLAQLKEEKASKETALKEAESLRTQLAKANEQLANRPTPVAPVPKNSNLPVADFTAFEIYREMTNDPVKFRETYAGKLVAVRGIISGVDNVPLGIKPEEGTKMALIKTGTARSDPSFFCHFDQEHFDLSQLKRDAEIKVWGIVPDNDKLGRAAIVHCRVAPRSP